MTVGIDRNRLAELIGSRLETSDEILVVGISGYGGSGKSNLARFFASAFPGSVMLFVDDYYVPIPLPDDDWAAYDRGQLRVALDEQLSQLSTKLVICEGVGLFHPDSLDRFDLKVWLNVDLTTATNRGRTRDREEYNVDHERIWGEEWEPTERRFDAKHDPKGKADYWVSVDL